MLLSTKIVKIVVDNNIFKILLVDKNMSKKTYFLLMTPLVVDWYQRWYVLHVEHVFSDICEQHDLVFIIQTKISYTSMLFFLFHEGFESCLINLHGVVFWQGCQKLG